MQQFRRSLLEVGKITSTNHTCRNVVLNFGIIINLLYIPPPSHSLGSGLAMNITGAGFLADLFSLPSFLFSMVRLSPNFLMSWSRVSVWSRGREQVNVVGTSRGGGAVADISWQI